MFVVVGSAFFTGRTCLLVARVVVSGFAVAGQLAGRQGAATGDTNVRLPAMIARVQMKQREEKTEGGIHVLTADKRK